MKDTACTHTYVHTYLRTHTRTYVGTYVCTYCTYLCIVCMCVHFICICTCTYKYVLCYIAFSKDMQGMDPLYGILRVNPEVFLKVSIPCVSFQMKCHVWGSQDTYILCTYVSHWSFNVATNQDTLLYTCIQVLQYRVCQPTVLYVRTYCCVQESRIKDYKQHLDEIVKIFYSTCKSVDSSLMLLLQPHAAKVMR